MNAINANMIIQPESVFPIPGLTTLFKTFAHDFPRLRMVFRLLEEQITRIADVQQDNSRQNWAGLAIRAEELNHFRESKFLLPLERQNGAGDVKVVLRPEPRLSDESVRHHWLEHSPSIIQALIQNQQLDFDQIVMMVSIGKFRFAGNRILEQWWVRCACLGGDSELRKALGDYTEQPQVNADFYDPRLIIVPSAPAEPNTRELYRILMELSWYTRNEIDSSICKKNDVRHILQQVVLLVHYCSRAIAVCMDSAAYQNGDGNGEIYPLDQADDTQDGLLWRALNAALDPFQNMLGNPASVVPHHIRTLLTNGNIGLTIARSILKFTGLAENMPHPGNRTWLEDLLDAKYLFTMDTALAAIKQDARFGTQFSEVWQELQDARNSEPRGWQSSLPGYEAMDESYIQWRCNSFDRTPRLVWLSEAQDDTDPANAVQEDVELEAVGPRIPVSSLSHALTDKPDDPCYICLEELSVSTEACVGLMECHHQFHQECLDTWINGVHKAANSGEIATVRCPKCRAVLCEARQYQGRPQ